MRWNFATPDELERNEPFYIFTGEEVHHGRRGHGAVPVCAAAHGGEPAGVSWLGNAEPLRSISPGQSRTPLAGTDHSARPGHPAHLVGHQTLGGKPRRASHALRTAGIGGGE